MIEVYFVDFGVCGFCVIIFVVISIGKSGNGVFKFSDFVFEICVVLLFNVVVSSMVDMFGFGFGRSFFNVSIGFG